MYVKSDPRADLEAGGASDAREALREGHKDHEGIEHDGFCIKMMDFVSEMMDVCIKNDEFCIKNDGLRSTARTTASCA